MKQPAKVESRMKRGEGEYRIYAVVSKETLAKTVDDQGRPVIGKLMAQAGHAFLHSYWDAEERFPESAANYRNNQGATKITLYVDTNTELFELFEHYKKSCGVTIVKDAGHTIYSEPTVTCVGIGPIEVATAQAGPLGKLKAFRIWKT